jgi:hypothetical protein
MLGYFVKCKANAKPVWKFAASSRPKTPKVEFHRYPARTDSHILRLLDVIGEYLDALDIACEIKGW